MQKVQKKATLRSAMLQGIKQAPTFGSYVRPLRPQCQSPSFNNASTSSTVILHDPSGADIGIIRESRKHGRYDLSTEAPSAFALSHDRVCQLVERFERHAKDRYLQPSYQEAEVRKDFIDPLLKALGWDVDHEREHNPYEQEVKVERAVAVLRSKKRADYAFYMAPNFHDVRFFVEAKKPSVDLARSVDAHFQTLRYGYSAKTPLAILTDFEQIKVLDCRRRPQPESALDQVWKSWHYQSFKDSAKFAEFYWLFSREAHADGSYIRRIAELPKPRGGAKQRGLFKGGYQAVDDSFLAEIEEYRVALAKAFKKACHALDSEQLTEMVQRTLDRLVFLRFLEDKQIETDIRIADLGKRRGPWKDFQEASRRLDSIYNGIVFKSIDVLDDSSFVVDDDAFGEICEQLAADNSPYNFDAIPIHILGSIYERFLGSVIRATAKRVVVEEKPEVRKAGGVYYTPEPIVRHIVKQTIGLKIAGKGPKEIAKLRFADIACGSGSFLLGVYDELLRYHSEFYNLRKNEKAAKKDGCIRGDDGMWRLSLLQRREILINNIFGVDIDQQAVEVAQLSLFLKLLEDQRATTARQYQLDYARDKHLRTVLPNMSTNILCGNSLIDWSTAGKLRLGFEEEKKLNPFDFEAEFSHVIEGGGFDAIVGNPPYEVVEKERSKASWPHQDFVDAVKTTSSYRAALGGKLNMFRFFIVRAISLVKEQGRLGMIVPLSLVADISCAQTRAHMVAALRPIVLDCFPQKDNAKRRVFKDAKLSTMIFTGQRGSADVGPDVSIRVYPGNSLEDGPRAASFDLIDTAILDAKNFPIPLVSGEQWALCRKLYAAPNVKRLAEVTGVIVTRGEINQTNFRDFISDNSAHARLVKGVEIGRYRLRDKLSQGYREWFDEKRFLKAHAPRMVVKKQRIATQRITGVDERLRVVAALVSPPAYLADSTNSIVLADHAEVCNSYLLAILNSKLMQWRFKITSTNNNVGTNELESLPIAVGNVKEQADISDLVDQMMASLVQEAQSSGRSQEVAARKCESIERQLDASVFALYGLSQEEVKLVEGMI